MCKIDRRCMIQYYSFIQVRVSIYVEWSGKILDTDQSAPMPTYRHWCLPGVQSHVAITSSPALCTEHLGCQCLGLSLSSGDCRLICTQWVLGWSDDYHCKTQIHEPHSIGQSSGLEWD